ncbi:replicative DNA helicase [Ectopseudomonas mendocina]|uniref:Replicative DNA helicase n=1 Tax=Ectopseudomonas mendocina TaxID=300 RepID=A0A379PPQ3_ECTME|nr:DnaB-like helicase C-terminal domain-containing protein [Pseudomonas mendocina]SUE95824.1 replicative DNA helicase [Pseudomonas mendocina]
MSVVPEYEYEQEASVDTGVAEEQMRASLLEQMARQMGASVEPDQDDEDDQIESVLSLASRLTPVPERAEEEKGFDFSEEFQTKIAALCISDETFYRRTDGLVKPEYFEDKAEATLVHISKHYHERYGRLPPSIGDWKELINDAKTQKVIREDDIQDIIVAFKKLKKTPLNGREYAVDKVAEFAKNQAVKLAYMECMDLIAKGEFEKAEQRLNKAFKTGAKAVVEDADYWNGIDARTQYRRDVAAGVITPQGITTGLPKLDKMLYHKGWGRKELSVIMGGAKKGKSTGLLHFAIAASMAGFNVLYATLEVSAQIIMDRMDANVSGIDMGELNAKMNEVAHGVTDRAKMRKPGHLKIVEYPTGVLTCTELRRALEFYRAQGIIFDLIITDYADIMAPEMKTGNDISDSKQVWTGLRAIAFEENAAVLTATQTNRDGFKADVARAEHAAEDFNKIRIADLVLTINRSEDERKKGEARLFFAASRNQQGEFTLRIGQDLAKMRFMTGILDVT